MSECAVCVLTPFCVYFKLLLPIYTSIPYIVDFCSEGKDLEVFSEQRDFCNRSQVWVFC